MSCESSKKSDKIYLFVHKQSSVPRISLTFSYNENKSISFTLEEEKWYVTMLLFS